MGYVGGRCGGPVFISDVPWRVCQAVRTVTGDWRTRQ